MISRAKLGEFLKEVIDWQWDEFCEAEKDSKYTSYQGVVFALVRACASGKLGAIELAIDRVDGKIDTPIKYEYPKFVFTYPFAKEIEAPPQLDQSELDSGDVLEVAVIEEPEPEVIEEPETVVTLTLRQTLEKMADQERVLVKLILARAEAVEQGQVDDQANIPLVKAVIAANLLHLAGKNNFDAITKVFDQIDGKLVETIRVLGEDIYLTQYAHVAPYGATKNKDGVYQIEAPQIADLWKAKLNKD